MLFTSSLVRTHVLFKKWVSIEHVWCVPSINAHKADQIKHVPSGAVALIQSTTMTLSMSTAIKNNFSETSAFYDVFGQKQHLWRREPFSKQFTKQTKQEAITRVMATAVTKKKLEKDKDILVVGGDLATAAKRRRLRAPSSAPAGEASATSSAAPDTQP